MSAADTIQKAIDKLERLASQASPGGWYHQPYGGQNQNGDYSGGSVFDAKGEYVLAEVADGDGALIVTLHRTIDAQLAILRRALRKVAFIGPPPEHPLVDGSPSAWFGPFVADGIALAEAILGGDS